MGNKRHDNTYTIIISFILDEFWYRFDWSVLELAEPGFKIEVATESTFLVLWFTLRFLMLAKASLRSWVTKNPNPWDRNILMDEMKYPWKIIKSFDLWTFT